ncbi:MAG: pyridoxamine 5'-phosphate oxidase family protein, partial [Candidatus Bipolaricaulota bacterium]
AVKGGKPVVEERWTRSLRYHVDPMPTYHMRRAEREIVERSEIDAVLCSQRYMALAMCRDGEPYVVTLNYGYTAQENALYFHCAHNGLKLDILRQTPHVCATVVEDLGYREGECSHAYRSVVVRGRMRVVADRDGKAHGLRVLLAHQEKDPGSVERRQLPDDAAYDRVTVLRLDIAEITGKRSD